MKLLRTPTRVAVLGASRNPFNPRTEISFTLPAAADVQVRLFDLRGRLVRWLREEQALY